MNNFSAENPSTQAAPISENRDASRPMPSKIEHLEEIDDARDAASSDSPVEPRAANEAPFSPLQSRAHQMYPVLTADEIDRVSHFGETREWAAGALLFETGKPGPGMFIVLKGSARITRRDGLGHVHWVVDALPGQFMAEIAQLSGQPALVDGHALEDIECILVRPERLRVLLVAEAELGERIMRSLILRRVGLIEKGSGPILVGKADSARLLELQSFLTRNNHPHRVISAKTDPDAVALLERIAPSKGDFPLVICPDGAVLRNPDDNQLASQLGWIPDFGGTSVYDVAIVGAGPAGLATAVYAASEGLSVVVFDARAPGGQAGASARIENYLGFPTGISGQALAGRAFAQAQKFGAHFAIPVQIKALHCECQPIQIELANGHRVSSHSVVIASGAAYRRPQIPGLEKIEGSGCYYWASPAEAKLCRGEEVALVGGGNSAGQAVVYLASHAARVHVLIRGASLESSMSKYLIDRIASLSNVTVHARTTIGSLDTDGRNLTAVHCQSAQGALDLAVRHLFLFTGANPNTEWLRGCNVATDSKGFVLTGAVAKGECKTGAPSLETSVAGVFAIGDVRAASTKRVAAAVGEGAAVVSQIHGLLAARQGMAEGMAPKTADQSAGANRDIA